MIYFRMIIKYRLIYHGLSVDITPEIELSVMITTTELFVATVALPSNDNIIFSENLKQVFKWIISCNKYKSEIKA